MSRARIILLLKVACWLVIGGFVVANFEMHGVFAQAYQPGGGIWCGNSVTEPLGPILNFGAPLAVAAVVPLAILRRRGLAAAGTVIPGALLVVSCTAWLLVAGIGFFQDALPGFHLSDTIWWMQPIGQFFGV